MEPLDETFQIRNNFNRSNTKAFKENLEKERVAGSKLCSVSRWNFIDSIHLEKLKLVHGSCQFQIFEYLRFKLENYEIFAFLLTFVNIWSLDAHMRTLSVLLDLGNDFKPS